MRSSLAAIAVAGTVVALWVAGAAMPGTVAVQPMLVVIAVGSGSVTSSPAGISCPGRCTATFAAGTSVVLSSKAKSGSAFLRWGGSCTGSGACRLKVSSLAVVGAQFSVGAKTQPTPTKSRVQPGSYMGVNPQGGGYPITFFVAPNGRSVLTVAIPEVAVTCATGSPNVPSFSILQAPITSGGAFAAKGSQTGFFGTYPNARYTYAFTGRFEAPNAAGAATAAGSFREDIAYNNGTANETCSSNDQTWTATRAPQPSQQKYAVSAGSYMGVNPQGGGYPITFSVAAGGKSLSTIAIPEVAVSCATGSPNVPSFSILQAAIRSDGSFAATGSQTGVFGTYANAKFTYAFTGYFEGMNAAGAAIAVGTFREDIAYNNGTADETCSSNDVDWTATRAA